MRVPRQTSRLTTLTANQALNRGGQPGSLRYVDHLAALASLGHRCIQSSDGVHHDPMLPMGPPDLTACNVWHLTAAASLDEDVAAAMQG